MLSKKKKKIVFKLKSHEVIDLPSSKMQPAKILSEAFSVKGREKIKG